MGEITTWVFQMGLAYCWQLLRSSCGLNTGMHHLMRLGTNWLMAEQRLLTKLRHEFTRWLLVLKHKLLKRRDGTHFIFFSVVANHPLSISGSWSDHFCFCFCLCNICNCSNWSFFFDSRLASSASVRYFCDYVA